VLNFSSFWGRVNAVPAASGCLSFYLSMLQGLPVFMVLLVNVVGALWTHDWARLLLVDLLWARLFALLYDRLSFSYTFV